jgi:hypothetical protein
MPVARRIAPQAPPPPPAGGSVSFGSEGFFSGGLGLPEGNYAVSFATQMFQPTKADGTPSRTPAFLAVMGTFYPIDAEGNPTGEPTEHPLSCGSQAAESFVPSADGKGFDAVPNGKAQGMWNLSAFGLFLDSMKNAGLPPGLITNSFDVLDGIWIHTQNIPEPEEKREFSKRARAKTGAAAMQGGQEDDSRTRTVTVVTEILEGGKPWEGTGGIPDAEAAPAAPKAAPKAGPKAVARPVARAAAPAPQATATSDEDVANAALNACSEVLGAKPNGLTKVALKTEAFGAAKKTYGDDVAQSVMSDYLQSDDTLKDILAELGYVIQGLMVKPQA